MHILHLRLFYRLTQKDREIYLLKILTLAIAMACAMLIALFAEKEFSYDRFHEDAHNVVRILQRNGNEKFEGNRLSNRIPFDVLENIKINARDRIIFSRVKALDQITILYGTQRFADQRIYSADSLIVSVFSFELADGSIRDFETNRNAALISASAARQYFGTTQAIKKTFKVFTWQDTIEFTVAGVYQDYPVNVHEAMRMFVHLDNEIHQRLHFNSQETGVYGRMDEGIAKSDAQALINRRATNDSTSITYHVQPLPDIYFGPRVDGELARHGDFYSVMILLCIAGLICFLSLTNFINLTTLTFPKRARELAVKKVFGAGSFNLLTSLSREYFMIATFSMVLALFFLITTNPWTTRLLAIDFTSIVFSGNYFLMIMIISIVLIVTIAPLLFAFRFTSASAARLLSTDAITFPAFKRTVMIFQLGVSVSLLIAGFIVNRQINHSLIKEPGKNLDQVIYFRFPSSVTEEGLYHMKKHWKNSNPHIVEVIALSHLPDNISRKSLNKDFFDLATDHDFIDFFDFPMANGRWFRVNDLDSAVVNKKALKGYVSSSDSTIGTIHDFGGKFHQPDKPVRITMAEFNDYNFLCIRILEVNIRHTVEQIERSFKEEGHPVVISFFDKQYQQLMFYEDSLGDLTGVLTLVSALMACCAIYSLSLSVSRDKLKQIAIHKIFGASTMHLIGIFIQVFSKQLMVAVLIFCPVTYILLKEWLRIFVYTADFEVSDPVIAIGFCMAIVSVTCSLQARRLNRESLVEVLKG